jgi:phage terminase large subunit-like protein
VKIAPEQLVQYITWYATEQGDLLTPIRLVKFLYLADLFHARKFQGKTITKWPWRFVHYGPFCGEALEAIENAIGNALIESIAYESKFDEEDHFLYKCRLDKEHPLHEILPIAITAPLENAIKKWGGETYQLLDYVYFETEPMEDVHFRDLLDFNKAKKTGTVKSIEMKSLSKEKINQAKEAIQKLKNSFLTSSEKSNVVLPIYDDIYHSALEIMDESELAEVSGYAEIAFEEG